MPIQEEVEHQESSLWIHQPLFAEITKDLVNNNNNKSPLLSVIWKLLWSSLQEKM